MWFLVWMLTLVPCVLILVSYFLLIRQRQPTSKNKNPDDDEDTKARQQMDLKVFIGLLLIPFTVLVFWTGMCWMVLTFVGNLLDGIFSDTSEGWMNFFLRIIFVGFIAVKLKNFLFLPKPYAWMKTKESRETKHADKKEKGFALVHFAEKIFSDGIFLDKCLKAYGNYRKQTFTLEGVWKRSGDKLFYKIFHVCFVEPIFQGVDFVYREYNNEFNQHGSVKGFAIYAQLNRFMTSIPLVFFSTVAIGICMNIARLTFVEGAVVRIKAIMHFTLDSRADMISTVCLAALGIWVIFGMARRTVVFTAVGSGVGIFLYFFSASNTDMIATIFISFLMFFLTGLGVQVALQLRKEQHHGKDLIRVLIWKPSYQKKKKFVVKKKGRALSRQDLIALEGVNKYDRVKQFGDKSVFNGTFYEVKHSSNTNITTIEVFVISGEWNTEGPQKLIIHTGYGGKNTIELETMGPNSAETDKSAGLNKRLFPENVGHAAAEYYEYYQAGEKGKYQGKEKDYKYKDSGHRKTGYMSWYPHGDPDPMLTSVTSISWDYLKRTFGENIMKLFGIVSPEWNDKKNRPHSDFKFKLMEAIRMGVAGRPGTPYKLRTTMYDQTCERGFPDPVEVYVPKKNFQKNSYEMSKSLIGFSAWCDHYEKESDVWHSTERNCSTTTADLLVAAGARRSTLVYQLLHPIVDMCQLREKNRVIFLKLLE